MIRRCSLRASVSNLARCLGSVEAPKMPRDCPLQSSHQTQRSAARTLVRLVLLAALVGPVGLAASGSAGCVDTDDGAPCSRAVAGAEADRCANIANFEQRRIPPPGGTRTSRPAPRALSPYPVVGKPLTRPATTATPGKSTGTAQRPDATPTPNDQPLPFVVTDRLLYRLDDATIAPPLTAEPATNCAKRLKKAAASNPFSGERDALNAFHQRVPLLEQLRLTDIRDAITLEAPRTLEFPNLESPASPEFRFAYAVSRCPGWERRTISMHITVKRVGKEDWHETLKLRRPTPGWTDLRVKLPTSPGERFTLHLALAVDATKPFMVTLGQLNIVGRTRPAGVLTSTRPVSDRNVLLVVIDALRADVVGPSRHPDLPVLAPNLEAFMARGTTFKRTYSVSNQTRHATLAMFTSQPPTMGRFFATTWNIAGSPRDNFYAAKPPLLPLIFGAAGWNTDTIGHNRFLFGHHPMGMDHGFDRIWNDARRGVKDTPALVSRGIARLAEAQNQRFFHYFNLVTPHVPYKTPDGYSEQIDRMVIPGVNGVPGDISLAYLAEIRYLDDEFGRFIQAFDRLGLGENTVVAITADHGELFSRHHLCRSNKQRAWCQNNHGLTLYDEEMRVPLAFIGPGIPAGRVVDTPTSLIDLAPTLVDAAGLPQERRHVGVSLLPLLQKRPNAPAPSPVYAESKRVVAVVDGDLKLMVHHRTSDVKTPSRIGAAPVVPKLARLIRQRMRREGTLNVPRAKRMSDAAKRALAKKAGRFELYDLAKDPGETTNLALAGDPRVAVLHKRLGEVRQLFARRLSGMDVAAVAPRGTAAKSPTIVASSLRAPAVVSDPAAFNVLLLRGGGSQHHLVGTIAPLDPSHTLTCGTVHGKATCRVDVDGRLHVSVVSDDISSGTAFRSHPWRAPLSFDLRLDGKNISRRDFKFGPFGVGSPSAGEATVLDLATLRYAQTTYPPRLGHSGAPGLFFWRDREPATSPVKRTKLASNRKRPGSPKGAPPAGSKATLPATVVPLGPEAVDAPAGSENMSSDMRKILKELGYSN